MKNSDIWWLVVKLNGHLRGRVERRRRTGCDVQLSQGGLAKFSRLFREAGCSTSAAFLRR